MKKLFIILSRISPQLASIIAFDLFCRPNRKKSRRFSDSEREWDSISIPHSTGEIICYEMGDASYESILLIHGWGGHPSNFEKMAQTLIGSNRHVVLLQLPAHGSSRNRKTNIRVAAAHVGEVLHRLNVANGSSTDVITHSFGSAVLAYAMKHNGARAAKVAMISNPYSLEKLLLTFQNMIGIADKTMVILRKRVEKVLGNPTLAVSMNRLINSYAYSKLLLIHDQYDRVLPVENSVRLNLELPGSELYVPLSRKGHNRILKDEEIISYVGEYIMG
jgi:pimeloyl-ACP methyl ester carboxylesterase